MGVLTRLLSVTTLLLTAGAGHAADSPQFRGADRTGIFNESGLLQSWPEGGPAVLWKATGLGAGFSSAVTHAGRVYVTGANAEHDGSVFVLDLDGKLLEQIPYGKEDAKEMAQGSRSTPTIVGDRLYLLSALGVEYCIDLPSKAVVWQVNILERFQAPNNEWSVSESLLVDDGKVYCTPGGPDAAMAALDAKTGDTVWATAGLTDMAGYVAPMLANHNGRQIIFTETSKYLICVDAKTGQLLWKHDHPTQYDIHAVSPIYKDGLLYYVAGYKSGGGQLKLSEDASSYEVVWQDVELDCQHHGVVLIDGYLYGASHHRGGGKMTCLDWKTGAVQWATRDITQAATVAADGMLYTYEGPKRGIVSLVKPSPTALEIVSQFTVTEGTEEHWAHPTISNGRLYIRHGDTLLCYDITAK